MNKHTQPKSHKYLYRDIEDLRVRLLRFEIANENIAICVLQDVSFALRKIISPRPIDSTHKLCMRQNGKREELKVLSCYLNWREENNNPILTSNIGSTPIWFEPKRDYVIGWLGPYPRLAPPTKDEIWWPSKGIK